MKKNKENPLFQLELKEITLSDYYKLLNQYSLNKTWTFINNFIKEKTILELKNSLFAFDSLGELYEMGLAYLNQIEKKEMGKYFTPKDVSDVMSEMFLENYQGNNIVDVGCGTGNLILEVLTHLIKKDKEEALNIVKTNKIFLMDIDEVAVSIALTKISILLNEDVSKYINVIIGDFLDKKIKMPKNASVISNPPYSLITKFQDDWFLDEKFLEAKDLYVGFMIKILSNSTNAVIVSPQSFLASDKYDKFRRWLGENYSGEIFAFDNVPGTLFNGRKHGVFNTNVANGVRAAITNVYKDEEKGFRLTHMIRFKSDQRNKVIDISFLKSKLGNKKQDLSFPLKTPPSLEEYVYDILRGSKIRLEDLISTGIKPNKKYKMTINTSSRYFTVGVKKDLNRVGKFDIYPNDEKSFILLYALLNSSYYYMWWRLLDGGISFTKTTMFKTPISKKFLNIDEALLKKQVSKMIKNENKYTVYKVNAKKPQESVKFPPKYREELNEILFPNIKDAIKTIHDNYEEFKNEKK